eukprot:SAG31_NODE_11097_length_1066_cov_1.396070_1_plen_82_part_01
MTYAAQFGGPAGRGDSLLAAVADCDHTGVRDRAAAGLAPFPHAARRRRRSLAHVPAYPPAFDLPGASKNCSLVSLLLVFAIL